MFGRLTVLRNSEGGRGLPWPCVEKQREMRPKYKVPESSNGSEVRQSKGALSLTDNCLPLAHTKTNCEGTSLKQPAFKNLRKPIVFIRTGFGTKNFKYQSKCNRYATVF